MEPAAGKVKRTPSSLLFRISDICKVHSVGVAPTVREKLKSDSTATVESSEDSAHLKVHPHQVSDPECIPESSTTRCEEAVVEKLLEAISGLKLAYVNLQQAHVPYDPEEIMIADQCFESKLEETAELKDLYVNVNKWSNQMYKRHVSSRIKEHQSMVMELQAVNCKKDSEIVCLRAELGELERQNMELNEKIDRKAMCREGCFRIRNGVPIEMFMDLFEFSSKSIHDFAKLIIGWTKVSGWNLELLTSSIVNSVVYEKKADKKYAVEAYFAGMMLMGDKEDHISAECFDHIMSSRDPFDALMGAPDSSLGRFCRAKYLLAVPRSMEDAFFGNLDHRAFVEGGGHPRTAFYQAFVRMAGYVWALLIVARYSNPRAEMFYVKSGMEFRKAHMECMPTKLNTEEGKISVGFTVMPGFKIGCTVMRCRVYLLGKQHQYVL